jgi:hypothetical protein
VIRETELVTWASVSVTGDTELRRMASSGMLHHVALGRTDVSEELSASFIRVTRIGELETALAVTSNQLHQIQQFSGLQDGLYLWNSLVVL